MKKQTGSAALIVLIVLIVTIVGAIGVFLSYSNKAVDYEQNINKFDKASQNTLSNYTLKVQEMFQVSDEYNDTLKELIKNTFEGRYGADGSKATMQWIKENNIQYDSSMLKAVQDVIRSGRDEFKLSQDRKLEICTQYDILTHRPVSKFILGIVGYPSLDVQDKCRIVLDKQTLKTFETGIAEPVQLRSKK